MAISLRGSLTLALSLLITSHAFAQAWTGDQTDSDSKPDKVSEIRRTQVNSEHMRKILPGGGGGYGNARLGYPDMNPSGMGLAGGMGPYMNDPKIQPMPSGKSRTGSFSELTGKADLRLRIVHAEQERFQLLQLTEHAEAKLKWAEDNQTIDAKARAELEPSRQRVVALKEGVIRLTGEIGSLTEEISKNELNKQNELKSSLGFSKPSEAQLKTKPDEFTCGDGELLVVRDEDYPNETFACLNNNGRLMKTANVSKNKILSAQTYIRKDGKLEKIEQYTDGKLVSETRQKQGVTETTQFDSSGSTTQRCEYFNGGGGKLGSQLSSPKTAPQKKPSL